MTARAFELRVVVGDDLRVSIQAFGPFHDSRPAATQSPVCSFEFQAVQRTPSQEGLPEGWTPEGGNPMAQVVNVVRQLQGGGRHEMKDPLDMLLHTALHQLIAEIEKALEPDA